HIDGGRTVWVSEPETAAWRDRTDTTLPTGVILQGMTDDGHTVFFVTDSRLVDADTNGGPDLYRYTDSADPENDSNLTMISQNGDTANSLGTSVVGFNGDGERVYYHTTADRLVLWDHGSTEVITSAVVRNPDSRLELTVTAGGPGLGRVSPDGMYMA